MAFLKTMDPSVDNVGLAVLPPAPSQNAACVDVDPYFNGDPSGTYGLANPAYTVVPLSNTYASAVGQLNVASPLVSTVNCVQAGGNTAYAEALDAAYAELQADGRPDAQKAIVILSDGAANTGPSGLPSTSPYRTNPCGQGVTSAGTAKAAGVFVYSIAYTADGDDCYASVGADVNGTTVTRFRSTLESPSLGAKDALEQIATPGSGYFYDLPDPTSLTGIFRQIAANIAGGTSRIVQ
ncbi:MAG: vWA domain-containing protein [Gaiellales bacterium]